ASNKVVLGAEIDGNPYVDMQVAAVLVYDRALSPGEHQQVLQYLDEKYLNGSGGGQAPYANEDMAVVMRGQGIVIDVLANDVGMLDPSSVQIVFEPLDGVTSVDASTGKVTYTHNGISSLDDSFTYQVASNDEQFVVAATVFVDVQENDSSVTITS